MAIELAAIKWVKLVRAYTCYFRRQENPFSLSFLKN